MAEREGAQSNGAEKVDEDAQLPGPALIDHCGGHEQREAGQPARDKGTNLLAQHHREDPRAGHATAFPPEPLRSGWSVVTKISSNDNASAVTASGESAFKRATASAAWQSIPSTITSISRPCRRTSR